VCCYAESHYAEVIMVSDMLSVVMQSGIMLSVVAPTPLARLNTRTRTKHLTTKFLLNAGYAGPLSKNFLKSSYGGNLDRVPYGKSDHHILGHHNVVMTPLGPMI
jgi:hypothetical protein